MWVDAYDRVEDIETWSHDIIMFTCKCGKRVKVATGEGMVDCGCGRIYHQSLTFQMSEPVSTELEQYLIRLRAATDAFDNSVNAFKEAGESLEKRLNERKGCDCGCS